MVGLLNIIGIDRVPMAGRRAVAATIVSALMYFSLTGGLVNVGHVPALQVGAILGIAVGLVAGSAAAAGLAAGVPLFLLGVVSPPVSLPSVDDVVAASLVAAFVGVATVRVVAFDRRFAPVMMWTAVALIVLTAGLTVWTIAESTGLAERRSAPRPSEVDPTDGLFYREVMQRLVRGEKYYDAWAEAYVSYAGEAPTSVLNVRPPGLFLVLSRVPGAPHSAMWVLFVLASAAVCSIPWIVRLSAPMPLALPACAALMAISMTAMLTPTLLYHAVWVGLLILVSAALLTVSYQASRPGVWVVGAAATAAAALVLRALSAIAVVAGLVSSLFGPRAEWRLRIGAWTVALLVGLGSFAIHASQAIAIVRPSTQVYQSWTDTAGLAAVWSCVTFNGSPLGPQVVPAVLVLLGVIGALVQPNTQTRVYASLVIIFPLVSLLFVAPTGFQVGGGQSGHWGAVILPTAFAFAPAGIAWMAGVQRVRPTALDER